MTALAEFLDLLFVEGRAAFSARPAPEERAPALVVLERAHTASRLDVAGPLLPFDADVALAAAEFVRLACWFLVNREEPTETLERLLIIPPEPRLAAQHWAADLTFRYLPQLQRRARALSATIH